MDHKRLTLEADEAPYIVFTGDFCPFDKIQTDALALGEELRAILNDASHVIVNLECPITDSSVSIPKCGPSIKADRSVVRKMREIGVTHCNLANNHIKDFGPKGIFDTLETLNETGFCHFGLAGGGNEVLIEEINGFRVAFISFTENEFSTDLSDGIGAIGMDYAKQHQQISSLRNIVDHVIVQYHGGIEFYSYPTPWMQKYCRFLVDCGASLVICHHTHCISGAEEYKQRKIYYGLGNFFFPEIGNSSEWYKGLAIKVQVTDRLETVMVSVHINQESYLEVCSTNGSSDMIDIINKSIIDPCELQSLWDSYCIKNRNRTLRALFRPGLLSRAMYKMNPQSDFLAKKVDLAMLNLVRCESHYARLIRTIELINKETK